MRHYSKYFIFATLSVFAACSEIDDPNLIGTDNPIIITSGFNETRTILHPDDLTEGGTQIMLYGYASGSEPIFEGCIATPPKSSSSQQGAVKISSWSVYEDVPATDGSSTPVTPTQWEKDKDYAFYSWLQADKDGKKPDGDGGFFTTTGFTYSDAVPASTDVTGGATPATLSIGTKKMEINGDGLDFCYSDVVTRKAGGADFSPVNLQMNHLFASFSLVAKNYMTTTVTIKQVTLYGLTDIKSAVIKFPTDPEEDSEQVTYTSDGSTMNTYATGKDLLSSDVVLSAAGTTGDGKPIIADGAGNPVYVLMWPQTDSELTTTITAASSTAPTEGTACMKIEYTTGSGTTQKRYVKLPKDGDGNGWPAGVCQNMELAFSDKSLSLTAIPKPWNKTVPEYDYEGAASVTGKLSLLSGSRYINPSGTNDVYFETGYPILLEFKIASPLNASWMIEKIGDFDAFEIDDVTPGKGTGISGDGDDTKEGVIDGEVVRIAIYPKIANPQKDYHMQMSFTVRGNNGTVTPINYPGVYNSATQSDWFTFHIIK